MMIDTNNLPDTPDSNLDSDLSQIKDYEIQCGMVGIAPGDWLDVDPCAGITDPDWGLSFQVMSTEQAELCILWLNDATGAYEQIFLSPGYITNNYRRVSPI